MLKRLCARHAFRLKNIAVESACGLSYGSAKLAKQRSDFARQIGLGRKKGEKVGSRRNTGKAPQIDTE